MRFCSKIDFRRLKTNQTSLKILCRWSIYNWLTTPNKLENIHVKETDIFRIRRAYLKLLLDYFSNFSTCACNKHRFFLVFDYTGSTMNNSACNFRQKSKDFRISGLLFSEKKIFRSPTPKNFIFLENFAVFSLAISISAWKILCFVLFCIYKRKQKSLVSWRM